MKEYRIARGWAVFIYITAPLLIIVFGYLLIVQFTGSERDLQTPWILVPVSTGMIAVLVLGILDTMKSKFIIDHNKIYSVGLFSRKELILHEITGYRLTDNYIFIESNDENKKTIKISTYLGSKNEVIEWLSANYNDLDIVRAIEEKEEILNSEQFGATPEQAEAKLRDAHKAAKILNLVGGIIGAWTFFFPKPYQYAIMASIVFPVICIIVLKYFKGLIKISPEKESAYPNIFPAIIVTNLVLGIRASSNYNIFDYSKIWMPVILLASVFLAVLAIASKEFKFRGSSKFLKLIFFFIFSLSYSYGAVISLNCIYDKSEPERFNARILNKRISSGKHTSYYLQLTAWGPQNTIEDVSVSRNLYTKLEKDDEVKIYFRKGRFEISWFIVTE